MADRKVVVEVMVSASAMLSAVIKLTPGQSRQEERLLELYRAAGDLK